MNKQLFRRAIHNLSVGLLAASTFAYAQDSAAPPAPPAADQQQNTNAAGGWRRVGDPAPSTTQSDPNYAANQNTANPGNGYPPYSSGDPNQASDPNQSNDANQAPPPVAAPNQPNYGNQPNDGNQPHYGSQPNYNNQQNYPPPPQAPAQLTIPAGTYINVRTNQFLSSDKNQVGDPFAASLTQPLVVNGFVIAEPGETIGGRVAMVQKHGIGKPAKLGIQLTTLSLVDGQQIPVNTQLISRSGRTTPGGVEAGAIVATTGVGAAIGAAAGWGTGAAIGAGAGALAGIIGAVVTHNHASVIYPEQILTFRLEAPVTFSTSNAPQAFNYVEPNQYDRPYYGQPAPQQYSMAAPPPAGYAYDPYAYGYPYAYGGYPYYWGPGFGFYFGPGFYYGRGYGYRGFYGGGYYGGRGYVGGGYRGGVGGAARGGAVGGGRVSGGHR